jgi:hypothetical protein
MIKKKDKKKLKSARAGKRLKQPPNKTITSKKRKEKFSIKEWLADIFS